jgi:hypothetical protein
LKRLPERGAGKRDRSSEKIMLNQKAMARWPFNLITSRHGPCSSSRFETRWRAAHHEANGN